MTDIPDLSDPEVDAAAVALNARYRRLTRRARILRALVLIVVAAAFYLPVAKGADAVRFIPLGHTDWETAVVKTALYALVWGVWWSLPIGATREVTGYLALSRADKALIRQAYESRTPPTDPLLRRVADARAPLLMRGSEFGTAHVIALAAGLGVIGVFAEQWWTAVLWLGLWSAIAVNQWRSRGQSDFARAYLSAPRP